MTIKRVIAGARGLACGLVVWLALGGIAWANDVKPVDPQPAADELKPGLAVRYYYEFFRHIRELVEWEGFRDGNPGEPLLELDSHVGEDKVLGSDRDDGVGARITGLIHLENPGTYKFAFESNDGVRLEIGDRMIVEDPDVHSDRYSEIGTLDVSEPGWYPLTIRYFERKSTSTLRFFWLQPGEEGSMALVPPEVLAHLPE